jgi:putative ABC transport system permease protein
LQLDPARPLVTVIARDLEPARLEAVPLIAPQHLPPAGSIPVWVSEAMRDLYGAEVGQRLVLPLGGADAEVTVAGIWRDYVRQGGAVLISRADYVRMTGDRLASQAWIWLEPGQSPEQAQHALRQRLGFGPEFELREPGMLRARSLAIFDKTFAVTYALQFAALTIALFGIGIGFSAQAFARRSEFGMLHHVGMSRRELSYMLSAEGALLGVLGAIAGLLVGAAMSYVLIHVINRQSFHWSMEMYWPTASLASVSIALILCCTVTATVSARRALGADAISAVREDW